MAIGYFKNYLLPVKFAINSHQIHDHFANSRRDREGIANLSRRDRELMAKLASRKPFEDFVFP
jgi:ribosomal protein L9